MRLRGYVLTGLLLFCYLKKPNNLKFTQPAKVLIYSWLANKAKARLPAFSHNLHLDIYSISLTFSNMYQIPTCRLFENTRTYPSQITHQPPLLPIAREKRLYLSMRTHTERRTCHPVHIAPQKTKHPCCLNDAIVAGYTYSGQIFVSVSAVTY